MKKNNNQKNSKNNKSDKNRRITDLTSYISPEMVQSDVDGSYTGVPADMYYNNELDEIPVQDADDL